MNEIDLQKLVEDKKEITAEMLEEIRQSELKADPDGEAKILKALGEVGSMVYRDLRRKTRLRSERLKGCLESLVGQGRLKIQNSSNTRGPPTTIVTMVHVCDNSPGTIEKRKAAMYRAGV